MKSRFQRVFGWVAAVHLGVLAVLLLWHVAWGFHRPPRPPELITFVELAGPGGAPLPGPVEPASEPPTKAPVADPTPPPPPRPPPPSVIPEPAPPRIQKGPKVKRTDVEKPPPAPKTPSEEEIRQRLAKAMGSSSTPKTAPRGQTSSGQGGAPGTESPVAWYYALVRQILYDAWEQPVGSAAAAGLTADVEIVVQRDGTITSRRMRRPSGHTAMDTSIMKAVESVKRLRPLPPAFDGAPQTIVIVFELQRDAR